MNDEAFRELVRRMRAKQRQYDQDRSASTRNEMRDHERRVDRALEAKTPGLFDQGGEG